MIKEKNNKISSLKNYQIQYNYYIFKYIYNNNKNLTIIGVKIEVIEIDFEDRQNMGKGRINSDRERLDVEWVLFTEERFSSELNRSS